MRRVVVIGAGGHGQVVADILLAVHRTGAVEQPIGFLDDDNALVGSAILDLPVIGPVGYLAELDFDAAIVGIGDNAARRRITRLLIEREVPLASAVHPSAIVSPSASLGQGIVIAAGVVVNTSATIEDGAILNTSSSVDHHCRVGSFAHVAPGVRLAGSVEVGEGTLVGVGSIVLPGKRVGEWAVVGAGAVVTKDVPDSAVVVGNPARVIRHIDQMDEQKESRL